MSKLCVLVQSQERIQMNGILANAVEWGVKVLHVDGMINTFVINSFVIVSKMRCFLPS